MYIHILYTFKHYKSSLLLIYITENGEALEAEGRESKLQVGILHPISRFTRNRIAQGLCPFAILVNLISW
jgi:hypothetical protein